MNMQSVALMCSPVFKKKKAHMHLSNGLDFFKGKDIDKDTQARIATWLCWNLLSCKMGGQKFIALVAHLNHLA